ncbi:MAG: HaeII family restriction endonuclease [Selenomonadaceae bacterium]|nr:HaeII family restriction endonuclease [Selenomonadaceae bacterium]
MNDLILAKSALDNIIKKSRIHLYKPIQIAEILYHDRVYGDIDLSNLETYRTKSKKWRDEISIILLGRKCTSSSRFQDDLFNSNALPPKLISVLGNENRKKDGIVESYIYQRFSNKHEQLYRALDYCLKSDKSVFSVKKFIDSFWKEPGLKRSIDKIYEIIVFALFDTLVDVLNFKVTINVDKTKLHILEDFGDFANKVMCITTTTPFCVQDAHVYRVGVTNAADRGLDMYSNWGPAIQIKHLTLDTELAKDIVNSVSSDKVVIVCKDAEVEIIQSILKQIGWGSHIQSIITESDLILWYDKALKGQFANELGDELLSKLAGEIAEEFPSIDDIPNVIKDRKYNQIKDSFWTNN